MGLEKRSVIDQERACLEPTEFQFCEEPSWGTDERGRTRSAGKKKKKKQNSALVVSIRGRGGWALRFRPP